MASRWRMAAAFTMASGYSELRESLDAFFERLNRTVTGKRALASLQGAGDRCRAVERMQLVSHPEIPPAATNWTTMRRKDLFASGACRSRRKRSEKERSKPLMDVPAFQSSSTVQLAAGVSARADDLQFHFARSGGPGGQNVNKVNTKAELRLRPEVLQGLTGSALHRLTTQQANRMTVEGELLNRRRFRAFAVCESAGVPRKVARIR